jgi:hypothetical protein
MQIKIKIKNYIYKNTKRKILYLIWRDFKKNIINSSDESFFKKFINLISALVAVILGNNIDNNFHKRKYLILYYFLRKYYRIKSIVNLNDIRNVEFRKLLIGQQSGIEFENWIQMTDEYSRISTPIIDSPYVKLLKLLDQKPEMLNNDELLRQTDYYKMCEVCIKATGNYMEARDDNGIIEQIKKFYLAYINYKNDDLSSDYWDRFKHSSHSSISEHIKVHKILKSDCYEIIDGHHRSAINFMKGSSSVKVEILGSKFSYLQKLILSSTWIYDFEYYQPLNKEELNSWRVIRKCIDRADMMFKYLEKEKIYLTKSTYADMPCSYGFFLKCYKDKGAKVTGVDIDRSSIRVGEIVYGLKDDEIVYSDVIFFLRNSTTQYDIVSCLSFMHHLVMGSINYPYMSLLKDLDRITNKVLFIDTGQSHEEQYKDKLNSWDDAYIIELIKNNTNFKRVIPLGKDNDNIAKQKNDNGRTLFVCVK